MRLSQLKETEEQPQVPTEEQDPLAVQPSSIGDKILSLHARREYLKDYMTRIDGIHRALGANYYDPPHRMNLIIKRRVAQCTRRINTLVASIEKTGTTLRDGTVIPPSFTLQGKEVKNPWLDSTAQFHFIGSLKEAREVSRKGKSWYYTYADTIINAIGPLYAKYKLQIPTLLMYSLNDKKEFKGVVVSKDGRSLVYSNSDLGPTGALYLNGERVSDYYTIQYIESNPEYSLKVENAIRKILGLEEIPKPEEKKPDEDTTTPSA
jgi:hypothetical protein